ncbi:hypothetical protein TNCT_653861, partial [Trichonephila clavata]
NQKRCQEEQDHIHLEAEREPPKDKRYQEGQVSIHSETRRQVEEVSATSRGNRSRPYKVPKGKDSTTTGFASEAERRFTIEQFDRRLSQRSATVEVPSGDSIESL